MINRTDSTLIQPYHAADATNSRRSACSGNAEAIATTAVDSFVLSEPQSEYETYAAPVRQQPAADSRLDQLTEQMKAQKGWMASDGCDSYIKGHGNSQMRSSVLYQTYFQELVAYQDQDELGKIFWSQLVLQDYGFSITDPDTGNATSYRRTPADVREHYTDYDLKAIAEGPDGYLKLMLNHALSVHLSYKAARMEPLTEAERIYNRESSEYVRNKSEQATFGYRMEPIAHKLREDYAQAGRAFPEDVTFTFTLQADFTFRVEGGTGDEAAFLQQLFNNDPYGSPYADRALQAVATHRQADGSVNPWQSMGIAADPNNFSYTSQPFSESYGHMMGQLNQMKTVYDNDQRFRNKFGIGYDSLEVRYSANGTAYLAGKTPYAQSIVDPSNDLEFRSTILWSVQQMQKLEMVDLSQIQFTFQNGVFEMVYPEVREGEALCLPKNGTGTFGEQMQPVVDYLGNLFEKAQQAYDPEKLFTFTLQDDFTFHVEGEDTDGAALIQQALNTRRFMAGDILDIVFKHIREDGKRNIWEYDPEQDKGYEDDFSGEPISSDYIRLMQYLQARYAKHLNNQFLMERYGFGYESLELQYDENGNPYLAGKNELSQKALQTEDFRQNAYRLAVSNLSYELPEVDLSLVQFTLQGGKFRISYPSGETATA